MDYYFLYCIIMATYTHTKDDKIIRSIFIHYDIDGDNSLTFPEFTILCADIGYDLYDFQFAYIDYKENNKISYDEFKEWWLNDDKFKILSYENIDKMYYAYDIYKKGLDEYKVLTFDNFNKMINKYYNCSIDENEFKQYDITGDNHLEFHEFLNWLRWF